MSSPITLCLSQSQIDEADRVASEAAGMRAGSAEAAVAYALLNRPVTLDDKSPVYVTAVRAHLNITDDTPRVLVVVEEPAAAKLHTAEQIVDRFMPKRDAKVEDAVTVTQCHACPAIIVLSEEQCAAVRDAEEHQELRPRYFCADCGKRPKEASLEVQVAALRQENAELRRLLGAIEWYDDEDRCAWCGCLDCADGTNKCADRRRAEPSRGVDEMSTNTGKVTIYGASDDLIEVEGVIREEFGAYVRDGDEDHKGWLLAFSDGTLLRIKYDGCWRITPVAKGRAEYRKVFEATSEDDDQYSDRVELEGEFSWCALCDGGDHQWATP